MRNIFLSFLVFLFSFSLAWGQKKDTVPTMVPKRITQKAPDPIVNAPGIPGEDSIITVPQKDSITYGFHFGLQVSKLLAVDYLSFADPAFTAGSKAGFNLGFYVSIPMVNHKLFFQPAIDYSEKGYVANTGVGKFRRTYLNLEAPLLLKYYPTKHLYFTGGPQISYLFQTNDFFYVSGTVEQYYVFERQVPKLRAFQPGINLGTGFDAGKRYSFSFSYSFDLLSNYSIVGADAPKFRNSYFNFRVGYRLLKRNSSQNISKK